MHYMHLVESPCIPLGKREDVQNIGIYYLFIYLCYGTCIGQILDSIERRKSVFYILLLSLTMDLDDIDDDLVPVKDDYQMAASSSSVMDPDHVFNQQRAVVAKLKREEIEDRYLRLLEENVVLKKHACKQVRYKLKLCQR
jgi:hypothetical protein